MQWNQQLKVILLTKMPRADNSGYIPSYNDNKQCANQV